MGFPKLDGARSLDIPTGPTDILKSSRPGVPMGGKRTQGSSKGLSQPAAKPISGKK